MPQLDRSRVSTAKLLVDGDYYGGSSAAVPFKWESQPGTPSRLFKRSSTSGFDSDLAPLTPPPSYFYASPSSTNQENPKTSNTHFGSLRPKNRSAPSSPAASSSSSSSTSSTSSVPFSPLRTPDLYARNSRRSMWFRSASGLGYRSKLDYNAKSSGCYASIIKVLLRDFK